MIVTSNFVVRLLVSFQYEPGRKSWCLFVISIYFENYFISPLNQHIHSFGFVVCVEKQFDKLILPIFDLKINKIAPSCTNNEFHFLPLLGSHHTLVKVIRLRH